MSRYAGDNHLPVVTFDEEGQLITYPGKNCIAEGCGVQLTSRNRYGHRRLCLDHGRETECLRDKARRDAQPAGASRNRPSGPFTPLRQASSKAPPSLIPATETRLIAALGTWLAAPWERFAGDMLNSALDDYELRRRLQVLIPRGTPIPIPVEDPIFTNPDHRTTRLEFLGDCSTHGV